MCRTRLASCDSDLDDECTSSGLIAKTPPRGTRQSTGDTLVAIT